MHWALVNNSINMFWVDERQKKNMPEWWDCSDGIVGIKRKRKTHNWNKIFMNCNENTHEKAVARMTRARWQKCFFSFVVVAAAVWRHHFFSANAYQIKSPNYFRTQCVIATVSIRFLLFFFLVGYHSFGMFEHCHVLRNDKHKKNSFCHMWYEVWVNVRFILQLDGKVVKC